MEMIDTKALLREIDVYLRAGGHDSRAADDLLDRCRDALRESERDIGLLLLGRGYPYRRKL